MSEKTAAVKQSAGDEGEIDKIIQEIEDLEKKMDKPGTNAASVPEAGASDFPQTEEEALSSEFDAAVASATAESDEPDSNEEPKELDSEVEIFKESKVVPMRSTGSPRQSSGRSSSGNGSLSLKVGSVADVELEFTKMGVTITLVCTDEYLSIITDQGAEFRVPFKSAA